MNPTRGSFSALLGLVAVVMTVGCAKPHPAEGLRPLPLVMEKESLTREAASLQPFFQWEPFPRKVELKADRSGALGRIQNVTYDLRIWRAEGVNSGVCRPLLPRYGSEDRGGPCIYPAELVYTRGGLPNPFHTVESPLSPFTVYLWAVRARFQLDGQPRLTEWSVLNETDEHRIFPKPRDGTRPSLGHYSFQTPGGTDAGAPGLDSGNVQR